jgi:hypothetical protein
MKARLNDVQRTLWALVFASLVLLVLAFPRGHNREYSLALDELTAFEQAFKQAEVEKSLLDYGRAQGVLGLADVQRAIGGPLVPKVQLAAAGPPIQPLAEIHLDSLQDVLDRARANSTLDIGSLNPAPLGSAISWRLARQSAGGRYQLQDVKLQAAEFTPADIELEAQVSQLRLDLMAAERAAADAAKKLTSAEELFEARRKRKLPWKILVKSDEARKEAKAVLDENQHTLDTTRERYESSAKRAEANGGKPATYSGKLPSAYGLAQIELRGENSTVTQLRIPVALTIRQAKLPPLAGTNFPATHDAGLWDDVKAGKVAQAIELTRSKFTWHYRYAEVAGLHVGGMTVLQVLPLILPLILLGLLGRMRHVSTSYNPFGTTLESKLPRVGLGSRALELAALVFLPLAAVALTSFALWAIAQAPVIPAIAAIAGLGLGAYAFVELGTLQALMEAVVRSHSNPPAKPEGGLSP